MDSDLELPTVSLGEPTDWTYLNEGKNHVIFKYAGQDD